jgi:hypothetical protein
MQEITKKIVILKILKEGVINYNMQVDTNIDKDELVGILTKMTQTVMAQDVMQPPQIENGSKHRPEYVG